MAKIPDGILSGFRGKIGPIVGSKRHGKYYIRSQPSSIKDPKSPKQLLQRNRMELVSPLAGSLDAFIRHTYGTIKTHRPRDPFMSVNLKSAVKVTEEGNELDYEGLMVSTGALKNVEQPAAVRTHKQEIRLSWTDNSGEAMAQATDRVLIMGLMKHRRNHYPVFDLDSFTRTDEEAVLAIGPQIDRYTFHMYICTLDKAGTMASNSIYLGER